MSRYFIFLFVIFSSASFANSAEFTLSTNVDNEAANRLSELLGDLTEPKSNETESDKPTLRQDKINTTVYEYGLAEGLFFQHSAIQKKLNENATTLYQIADFSKFIVDGKLLLPTAIKSSRIYEQISQSEGRTINLSITLDKPGKIVGAPPTWRDYLSRGVAAPFKLDPLLYPRDKKELNVFKKAFTRGWLAGVEQAEKVFELDYLRLENDLKGHYLFRQLVVQNVLRIPKIEEINNNVVLSGDGRTLHIDDVIYRIESPETFENVDDWVPIFTQEVN